MLKNLGKHIRSLREEKGISLNDFAKELGVSSGYLSQLETGKTETIQLKVLEKLQEELILFPLVLEEEEFTSKFTRIQQQHKKLSSSNPVAAMYLLSTFENGVNYFLKVDHEER